MPSWKKLQRHFTLTNERSKLLFSYVPLWFATFQLYYSSNAQEQTFAYHRVGKDTEYLDT